MTPLEIDPDHTSQLSEATEQMPSFNLQALANENSAVYPPFHASVGSNKSLSSEPIGELGIHQNLFQTLFRLVPYLCL